MALKLLGMLQSQYLMMYQVLTTDPWIKGKPYFGSWSHAYNIPKEQLDNIYKSKYIWLSHGHPDHIDPDSLDLF